MKDNELKELYVIGSRNSSVVFGLHKYMNAFHKAIDAKNIQELTLPDNEYVIYKLVEVKKEDI